jgi:hypothetical protein
MLLPTSPTIGLSQTVFTLNQQAVFQVYGVNLTGVSDVALSTSAAGIQWSVAGFSASATAIQITATPTSNGAGPLGDTYGDLVVTLDPGPSETAATYGHVAFRG